MILGYPFLIISVLAGVTKGYFGKKISNLTQGIAASVWVNLLRVGLCILISLLVSGASLFSGARPDTVAILTGTAYGCTNAFFIVSWLFCVRNGTYMLINIFLMLGMLITLILSNLFLPGESISLLQWGGIALLILAVLIMISYNTKERGKMTLSQFFLLFACGLSEGLGGFMQKCFQHHSQSNTAFFTLISYGTAALVLGGVLLLPAVKTEKTVPCPLIKRTFPLIAIMALCLFLNSFFKTEAAAPGRLTSARLYPVYESIGLILNVAMCHFLLKEKATLRCLIGCALSLIAVLLLK